MIADEPVEVRPRVVVMLVVAVTAVLAKLAAPEAEMVGAEKVLPEVVSATDWKAFVTLTGVVVKLAFPLAVTLVAEKLPPDVVRSTHVTLPVPEVTVTLVDVKLMLPVVASD